MTCSAFWPCRVVAERELRVLVQFRGGPGDVTWPDGKRAKRAQSDGAWVQRQGHVSCINPPPPIKQRWHVCALALRVSSVAPVRLLPWNWVPPCTRCLPRAGRPWCAAWRPTPSSWTTPAGREYGSYVLHSHVVWTFALPAATLASGVQWQSRRARQLPSSLRFPATGRR